MDANGTLFWPVAFFSFREKNFWKRGFFWNVLVGHLLYVNMNAIVENGRPRQHDCHARFFQMTRTSHAIRHAGIHHSVSTCRSHEIHAPQDIYSVYSSWHVAFNAVFQSSSLASSFKFCIVILKSSTVIYPVYYSCVSTVDSFVHVVCGILHT